MTTTVQEFPKTFAIWFKNLIRWDPSSFHEIRWHWPKEVMTPIGNVLKIRKEKVDRSRFNFSDLQPVTIHFDGSIDRREVEPSREYTMDLYFAHPRDIVVAKIDLKNGAVTIVPDDWNNIIVTSHFAVYKPDLKKLLPEYFHRIIQTSFFKSHLWRNKVGAEGRKEVKLDYFESLEIPIPTLSIQRTVVAQWEYAQAEIEAAKERIEKQKKDIDIQFFSDLGLKQTNKALPKKAFVVMWKDFLRWSVSYNQASQSGIDITKGKYPIVELGSLVEMIQYGTSEKANISGIGTPIIRMNNIIDGVLNLSALKHIHLHEAEQRKLLLKKGDILFNRTNSKELVGKCAVFDEIGDYVFASYLIRVRVDVAKAHPDYLAYVINSPLGRQQIDALSRQIIGQANINSEELRSFEIPLPPLETQQQIMQRIEAKRAEVEHGRIAARQKSEEIKAEIEALILGTKEITC